MGFPISRRSIGGVVGCRPGECSPKMFFFDRLERFTDSSAYSCSVRMGSTTCTDGFVSNCPNLGLEGPHRSLARLSRHFAQ